MRMKLVSLAAALSIMCLLPSASSADQLPFMLHGNLGFGKMLEDGAPSGGIGLGVGIIYPVEGLPIAIGGDIGWQMLGSEEESYSLFGATGTADVSTSTIPITGQVYYMFPPGESLSLYGVVGLGFYNLRSSIDMKVSAGGQSYSESESDSQTELGINGGIGARFGDPSAKISFGADVKYHVIMTDVENTDVITVYGRVFYR